MQTLELETGRKRPSEKQFLAAVKSGDAETVMAHWFGEASDVLKQLGEGKTIYQEAPAHVTEAPQIVEKFTEQERAVIAAIELYKRRVQKLDVHDAAKSGRDFQTATEEFSLQLRAATLSMAFAASKPDDKRREKIQAEINDVASRYLALLLERAKAGETLPQVVTDFLANRLASDGVLSKVSRNEAPVMALASCFNFLTGLESNSLMQSASDGAKGNGWRKDAQRGALIYEQNGASHRVELTQTSPLPGGETLEMDALEWLAARQNADFSFAFFYVCRVLAPPSPLPPNLYGGGWIDLDDVAKGIGYDLDGCTAAQREELRARVWDFLNYGARAITIGRRGEYTDRHTKKKIETQVESPPWRILDVERPVQTAMFGEVPRRVELLISKAWEPLLTKSNLAQYLPFAEVIGAIPANQTAGAWARVLGLSLANFWRRKPHEAVGLAPPIKPTRRELLARYTPKSSPPLELLQSDKPKRAVEYWRDALAILVEKKFLAKEGEAVRSVAQMLEPFGRQGWQEAWLDECVELHPGPVMWQPIYDVALDKPLEKPRALNASKNKGGRPKKKTD